jgi:glutamate transport system substrate-binding protein
MAVRSFRRPTAVFVAVIAGLLATGSGCGAHPTGKTPAAGSAAAYGPLFKLSRALRIGVKTDEPGLGMADSTGLNNSGLDVDLAKEIAKALHDEPVFQSVVSQNREQMIMTGAVDLVIATYSITEARLQKVAFAGPYLIAGQDILVREADAATYTGVDSLRDKKVCLLSASTSYQHLQDHFSVEWGAQHLVTQLDGKPILGYQTCVQLLVDGKVDAVSTDDVVLAGYANSDQYRGRLHLVGKRFSREKHGVGLAQGDPKDAALINAALRQMIQDGRWAAILRKNLGATASIFLDPTNIPTPPAGS